MPDFPANVEDKNNGSRKVRLEKGCGIGLAANREQCNVELRDKTDDVEEKTEPRSPDSSCSLERKIIYAISLNNPSFTEADMCKTY
jgi:hypothetical protein